MQENELKNKAKIEQLFDEQAKLYLNFAEQSFTWNYLEKVAFDYYISDLYSPFRLVLDVGCGSGRVIKHLISRGVLPKNITGVDISSKLLEAAKKDLPQVTFLHNFVEDIQIPANTFDLVTSNMLMHYLDNSQLKKCLDKISDALKKGGSFFFVESNPDNIPDRRNPENLNKWLNLKTPWGTTMPYFNRDIQSILTNLLENLGFRYINGWGVTMSNDGKVNSDKSKKYLKQTYRVAARFLKAC